MSDAPVGLNAAQLRAVHHLNGPCLVLAGAGSGKTRVIAHKIARLLAAGVAPERIAAITFTNKAAHEMRDRVRSLVGPRAANAVVASTFHALGVRILRSDGARVGLRPNFSIFDTDDALGVLRDAAGSTDNAIARRWQWAISAWKNRGLDAAAAAAHASTADEQAAAQAMLRYEERLAAFQAVDFDDLIGLALKLLQRDADARAAWRSRFDHVLVDEVQDTNAVQYALLKSLVGDAADATPFTAVGDDDQSIYGWRGATVENLAQLPRDYPKLVVIALEQNYRSTGHILRAANAVIACNPKLYAKTLFSELGDGEPVRIVVSDDEAHEADRAAARIQGLRHAGGTRWRDFAVLYRANHQSRVFEQKLRALQIPYRVSGGQSFFDRAEIRDVCAWLRLVVNADDDPAFLRAATTPRRGIGAQTLATLGEFAARYRSSLHGALAAPSLAAVLGAKAIDALQTFGRDVAELRHRALGACGSCAARAALLGWLDDIGYERHLHDGADSPPQAAARWANVVEFVDWAARRCSGGDVAVDGAVDGAGDGDGSATVSLLDVAQTIAVFAGLAERDADADVVTLSTLHAAKGLEWPHVLLAGVVEGLLPFRAAGDDRPETAGAVAEERRLMYVGITRAQRTLTVGTLKRRRQGRQTVAAVPSRFIAEMALDAERSREDPRERLKRLRDAMAAKASTAASATGPR